MVRPWRQECGGTYRVGRGQLTALNQPVEGGLQYQVLGRDLPLLHLLCWELLEELQRPEQRVSCRKSSLPLKIHDYNRNASKWHPEGAGSRLHPTSSKTMTSQQQRFKTAPKGTRAGSQLHPTSSKTTTLQQQRLKMAPVPSRENITATVFTSLKTIPRSENIPYAPCLSSH